MTAARARREMAHDLTKAGRTLWRALAAAWRLRRALEWTEVTDIELGGAAARLASELERASVALADLRRVAVRAAESSLRGAA
ncbi:MAG: hypothetical protein IT373_11925 [Polyangiaceae bacterium]|nr:hypothetical protein [Polyangiaceae bacterium]